MFLDFFRSWTGPKTPCNEGPYKSVLKIGMMIMMMMVMIIMAMTIVVVAMGAVETTTMTMAMMMRMKVPEVNFSFKPIHFILVHLLLHPSSSTQLKNLTKSLTRVGPPGLPRMTSPRKTSWRSPGRKSPFTKTNREPCRVATFESMRAAMENSIIFTHLWLRFYN